MRIVQNNNILTFELDASDLPESENAAFAALAKKYKFTVNGSTIFLHNLDDKLISIMHPFDNTQFLLSADAEDVAFAEKLGGKRFMAGLARKQMLDQPQARQDAIMFDRDMSFSLDSTQRDQSSPYRVMTLAEMQRYFSADKHKPYRALVDLFNRCADFTPGKQQEYLSSGKEIQDKYCRFNLDRKPLTPYWYKTEHLFLLTKDDKIAGTVSMAIIEHPDQFVDIYVYDEITNYFLLLDEQQKAKHAAFTAAFDLGDKDEKAVIQPLIAKLVEPARTQLLDELFTAARAHLHQTVVGLHEHISRGHSHAFIRAARGREHTYQQLGCAPTRQTLVIHDKPVPPELLDKHVIQLKLLDAHLKEWAGRRLIEIEPTAGNLSFLAGGKATADSDLSQQHVMNGSLSTSHF